MSELNWTNYVAVITGIVGATTGLSGAVMGYIAYRKANNLKSLDLRLELRKAANELDLIIDELPRIIDSANGSRRAVAAASGRFHSGMMQQWTKNIETDKKRVKQLSGEAPTPNDAFATLSHAELETKLVKIHRLQIELRELKSKYDQYLLADENARREIRPNAGTRFDGTR